MIYISLKDEDELTGITSFWEMDMDSSSTTKTNEIGQTRDCQTIGIVILDIPCFKNSSCAIGFGTITFSLEGKNLQSPIPMFKLDASQAIVKILTPRYADNIDYSILAIKSSSIEKIFKLPMKNGVGDKLLTYLADKDFVESRPDVYASKNPESFRYCLVEFIMQEFVDGINIKIYTRTTSQQNAMMHMFQTEFPEIIEIDKDEKIKEAAMILEREIDLRINSNNNCKILAAKITTDLFIQ
ncbi:hypothetical protein HCN44_005935 [Aphidius gifuensis]|uniref:Uncharacterized protein n=3 Tax=Aphidius gifuensis TaxID=684658 RepID=A0A835CRS2_APHGI|nr:hypothetical protein HCN44_005935 [Aphidius gifuensis]